jgi:hypothetical protein
LFLRRSLPEDQDASGPAVFLQDRIAKPVARWIRPRASMSRSKSGSAVLRGADPHLNASTSGR